MCYCVNAQVATQSLLDIYAIAHLRNNKMSNDNPSQRDLQNAKFGINNSKKT